MTITTPGTVTRFPWQALPLVSTLLLAVAINPAIAQNLPHATPEEVGMSSARLERLSDALQAYVDNVELAGATAIVVRRGKVAYLEAFGARDREARSPMAIDAIFRIASQTKAPISVGVMMLQEEGKLLITDRVGKYLPEFTQTTVGVANDEGGYDVVPANPAHPHPRSVDPYSRNQLRHGSGGRTLGGGRDHRLVFREQGRAGRRHRNTDG